MNWTKLQDEICLILGMIVKNPELTLVTLQNTQGGIPEISQATIHKYIHTYRQFRASNLTYFGEYEETVQPEWKPT